MCLNGNVSCCLVLMEANRLKTCCLTWKYGPMTLSIHCLHSCKSIWQQSNDNIMLDCLHLYSMTCTLERSTMTFELLSVMTEENGQCQ